MFGLPTFYKACKAEGVKPILGIETYVAPRKNTLKEAGVDNANYHLVLLFENNTGWQNGIQLESDAAINGFYYRARTDKQKLRQYHEGIIALSACLGGEVQHYLLEKQYEKAKNAALEYNDIFGQGNFYLELQDHKLPEQALVNTQLIRLSRETGIPLVCTNDCHYLNKDGFKAHDVLMAIQAKTTIDDTKRKKYGSDEFYVKSPSEMYSLFGYIPEAIENTSKIAERCNVELEFGKNKIPPFKIPAWFNGDNYDFLKHLAYEGAKKKYGKITDEVRERTEYELSVVSKMGYVNYFLIVWDFFRFCKEGTMEYGMEVSPDWEPILTGPGRGSGAGSILLFELDVTKLCPLQYDLLFERFLDPSRISMPD
jgi:DNA polymerase-3 subunit alpha